MCIRDSYWRIYHSGIYLSFNLKGSRVAYVDDATGDWIVTSDETLKKNISTLTPTLDKVLQLRPVSYHYKRQKDSDEKVIGFIAQETQPIFPEMVKTGEDGKLGMSYATSGIIAIKAIQEQQIMIEAQQKKLEQQGKEIEALKAMLEKIQSQLLSDN